MKTKKLIALGLAILMATSVFGVMSISAKDAFTPDDNLIYHWDFEGEGDEVFANKAPGAKADEAIAFIGTSAENGVSNGVATVGNGAGNALEFIGGDAATGTVFGGAKLNNCQQEYTLTFTLEVDLTDSAFTNTTNPVFYWHGGTSNKDDKILFNAGWSAGTVKFGHRVLNAGGYTWNPTDSTKRITGYHTYALSTSHDGTDVTMKIYMDNELIHTETSALGNVRIMSQWAKLYFGNGGILSGADHGVDANFADIRIYSKALNADEIAAMNTTINTPDVKDEAVVFEGVQFRNVAANTYDIRFVAKIAADNYTELGFNYDLAKWTGDGADKKTATGVNGKCDVAYRYLSYEGGNYDAGEGYYYISVTLEGVELTDAVDYFEATLTAYGVTADGTQYSDTYKMTAIDGTSCVFALVADN